MKVKFFSPSYKRGFELSSTQVLFPFVEMVVCETEGEEYRKSGNRVITCPVGVQGNLCRVRNWILDYCVKKNIDVVVIMDDDFQGVFRNVDKKGRKMSGDDLEEWAEMAGVMCEDSGVKFFGINPANDKGSYREHTPFSFLGYIGGPLQGHYLKGNDLRYDEKLPLKEDYDMTLQHLNKFRRVLRFNMIYCNVKQAENVGGCAVYRNSVFERQQFEDLIKKWGSRIVQKDEKSKRGFDFNPILKIPIKGV